MSSGLLSRKFQRQGPDHRQGREVGFIDIRRRFDFRSIRIGRWVTPQEQSRIAGLFHDALLDLMLILNGTEALISLRGTLALQYGTGGRPGVAAHYDPQQRSFALAKNAGPGSIAHEWFHAFDHYIADKAFMDAGPMRFGSSAWIGDATPVPHGLNDLLSACYRAVLLSHDGTEPSALFRRSAQIDRELGARYFSQPEELCARAFEAYVQDAAISNRFLVKGTRESPEARRGLYPQGPERQQIGDAFASYFSALGRMLRQRQAGFRGVE